MLKLPLRRSRGFTLVEMMIGITLLAVLTALAVPSFSLWIKNMGIRTTAESLSSGLQLARAEALRKNTVMRFQLTTSLGDDCALLDTDPPDGSDPPPWNWVVSRDNATDPASLCHVAPSETVIPRIVQTYDGTQSGGKRNWVSATASSFVFNGLGRLTRDSPEGRILVSGDGGPDNCASKDDDGDDGEKLRCLRIEVSAGGGIRLCDPVLSDADPQGCRSTSSTPSPPSP